MKNILKILFVVLLTIQYLEAKAGVPAPTKGEEPHPTDSITDIKSNIIILKLITTPSNTINTNGSLKKAGKVARTSYSHSIIDTLLYQKRGI
jgi:hypothetical protein